MSIELTEEQQQAVDIIAAWFERTKDENNPQEFKLGGYAGTGKTTVLKFLIDKLHINCDVMALTGKAVSVLRKKSVPASTIHSTIYDVKEADKGKIEFELKSRWTFTTKLFIVDESSMISTDLYNDIVSLGIPVLWVGDPGQLEPIGENPELMTKPDFTLQKIHRQAESSPILTLAHHIRKTGNLSHQKHGTLWVKNKAITSPEFLAADQVICAKNITRRGFNSRIRMFMKREPATLVQGEKLIVLRNNRDFGVFNGLILFVDEVVSNVGSYWEVHCHDEVGKEYRYLPIWKDPFSMQGDEQPQYVPKDVIWADYGYCITCHKAQGSEWDKVLIWDEWVGSFDMKRWRYTAITRAAKELTICL